MCVVAEGVENKEQLQYLKRHECDLIQGYLFSRPVPRDEAMKLIEAGELNYSDAKRVELC